MVVWVGFGKGAGLAFHVLTALTVKRAFLQPVYRIRGCKQHSGFRNIFRVTLLTVGFVFVLCVTLNGICDWSRKVTSPFLFF